ncbi:MAG: hypothetical protein NTV54_08230 [Ignavibacteriales bacterium]|nr:hypothetical protein [Ignavibacteriales bacterium]
MIIQYCRILFIGALIGIFLVQPVVGQIAQSANDAATACKDAERDAEQHTSGTIWFVAGCGLGILGVVGAYVIKPDAPASKMIGKSQEYAAAYSDCYKEKAQSIQTKNAWYGCGTEAVLYGLYFALVVAAATSTK